MSIAGLAAVFFVFFPLFPVTGAARDAPVGAGFQGDISATLEYPPRSGCNTFWAWPWEGSACIKRSVFC